ncbi:amidohydrolase family protein [Labrys wisconsinensis]|uniref:TIM-barrel fold metal-dependent hydrolase n=1 Tax=Labrys wisconsinensis TaxID=425677 RepID=A0ABU0J5T4_9HYPH|nr:amidohydrolase family protein [Labrys wisconsinensis]MDQ0469610.1 putative TIM-barrel fold metal-dependent hydrolase [Labrys wisconsinensis]
MTGIIDAHHHIWRQADLPWLSGPMLPRIFGPYESIRRDYPPEEYIADAAPHGVTGSVYVQANWAPARGLDEARWVQGEHERTGWPTAQVAYADLAGPDVAAELRALAAIPTVRGIRQQLHWHETPLYRFAARPDLMNDPAWRRGFALLGEHGLLFELQIFTAQFADGARLAADFPGTPFVLMHCGMPEDLLEAGFAAWREGLKRLAERPNMHVKLSGLGTFVRCNDPAHIARIVHETVAAFGPARCVFGSNFPIEKLWCGYGELIGAFRDALADHQPADREAMLAGNARRLYRL